MGQEVVLAQFGSNTNATTFGYRNKIINGTMAIDQRNSGSALTSLTTYNWAVDRFRYTFGISSGATLQRVVDAPLGSGFIYSNKLTCTSPQTPASGQYMNFGQPIEGQNISDLMFGTPYAKTVTLSFWVKCSLTGTFGGNIANYGGSPTRSYVFQYTISVANAWTFITVTIPGDTFSGTWPTDTSMGMFVLWSLGDGSSYQGTANAWQSADVRFASGNVLPMTSYGATWQITGVQLEPGSVYTGFDFRPYGIENFLCQRYYFQGQSPSTYFYANTNSVGATPITVPLPAEMRIAPTVNYSFVSLDIAADGGVNGINKNAIVFRLYSTNGGYPYAYGRWTFTANAEL